MAQAYSFTTDKPHAKVFGRALKISTKESVEVARFIRGKQVGAAMQILERVIKLKQPVPYKRYMHNVGHRPKMGPGRYPVNVAKQFLILLNSVSKNALDLGLNEKVLVITHANAHKGHGAYHSGRSKPGQHMKVTHVEIVVTEAEADAEPAKSKRRIRGPKKEADKK